MSSLQVGRSFPFSGSEIKTIKNRLHIDVAVHDLASATKQAERIGARKIGEVQYTASGSFQVLQDPEGNEWCLVVPGPRAPTRPDSNGPTTGQAVRL